MKFVKAFLAYLRTLGRDILFAFKHKPQLFVLLIIGISAATYGFSLGDHWQTLQSIPEYSQFPVEILRENEGLLNATSFMTFALFIIVVLNFALAFTFSKSPELKYSIFFTVTSIFALIIMFSYIEAYNVLYQVNEIMTIPSAPGQASSVELIRATRNLIIIHTVLNVVAALGSYLLSIGNLFGQKDTEHSKV